MNEIQRLAYLDTMGVDSYVSRAALPAAAKSQRARILRPVAPATSSNPVAASNAGPVNVLDIVGGLRDPAAVASKPIPEPVAAVAKTTNREDSGPVFSVLSVRVGGMLCLDEIPRGRDPGHEYLQLLQSIATALKLGDAKAVLERFDWPITNTRQLGNSEAAARDGFSGFLRGRMERQPVETLVLMGVAEATWLDSSNLGVGQKLETVSAWQMLRQPDLKRQAWSDLKQLLRP